MVDLKMSKVRMLVVRKRKTVDPWKRFDPFLSIMRKGGVDAVDRMNRRVVDLLRERIKHNRKRIDDDRMCEKSEAEVVAGLNGSRETAPKLELRKKSSYDEAFKPYQLWARTVRTVRLMTVSYIALRICATEIGLEATEQPTSSDGNDVTSESVKKTRMVNRVATGVNLDFKPRDFKAVKETRVPPAVVAILVKNPDQRTASDLVTIEKLMEKMPSFQKYNRPMQLAICKVVRYFKCEGRRVVLRRGHVAYSIYYIYTGSVKVIVDTGHVEADGSPKTFFVPLRKGACFGDVGVIRSAPRTATVVCAEDAEFLVIDREAYIENGLDVLQEEQLATRFKFFRVWPPIVRWSDSAIRDLCISSYTEEYSYNRLIVKDSSKGDMLWFVLEGICDVMRVVDEDIWRAAMLTSEEGHMWKRHYSKASQVQKGATSGIPDILEDRKKASCQFQRERFAEKMVQHLDFDRTGFEGCVGGSEWTPLPDIDAQEVKRRHTILHRGRRPLYFIKVGVLVEGDCFGLEYALPDTRRYVETKDRLYVVSRGCRIIRLSCSAFRDLTLLLGVREKELKAAVRSYHENDEICHWLDDKIKWRNFKKDVVERTLVTTDSSVKAANFLAHQLSEAPTLDVDSPNYSKPFKMIWTGSTLVGPTQNPYHVVTAAEALARGLPKLVPVKEPDRTCNKT